MQIIPFYLQIKKDWAERDPKLELFMGCAQVDLHRKDPDPEADGRSKRTRIAKQTDWSAAFTPMRSTSVWWASKGARFPSKGAKISCPVIKQMRPETRINQPSITTTEGKSLKTKQKTYLA